jgi:hypothetical protein
MMPDLTMSTHSIFAASKPMPFFSFLARSAMIEPIGPQMIGPMSAFSAIWRIGS